MQAKSIKIESKNLYRFIISSLRYGYTRNNHLEPSCTYSTLLKEILPKFIKNDLAMALHTIRQAAEECISLELQGHFYNGEEDEFGNRAESISFVKSLIELLSKYNTNYKIYNYLDFVNHLEMDNEKIYLIYEIDDKGNKSLVTEEKFSVKEYLNYLIEDVLKVKSASDEIIYYNLQRIKGNLLDSASEILEFADFKYSIKEPFNRVFYIRNTKNDKKE